MNSILTALQALTSASAQFLSSALYRACVFYSRPIFPSLSKSTKKISLKPVSLWTSEEGLLIRYTFSPPQAWALPCLARSSGPCPCPSSRSPQEFQLLLPKPGSRPTMVLHTCTCGHTHVHTGGSAGTEHTADPLSKTAETLGWSSVLCQAPSSEKRVVVLSSSFSSTTRYSPTLIKTRITVAVHYDS